MSASIYFSQNLKGSAVLMSRQPVLHIPSASKWDENINLKICGLNPFDIVYIVVTVKDEADVTWRSHAVFQANQSGEVNPATAIPLKGTYQVQDQMGLFWSMQPVGSSRSFQKNRFTLLCIALK